MLLEQRESQYHRNLQRLNQQELDRFAVVPRHSCVDWGGLVGDLAYTAPVQRSNTHGNGELLSGDAQLGRQGNVHVAKKGVE